MTSAYLAILVLGLAITVLAGWLAVEMSRRITADEELSVLRQKMQIGG